MKKKLTAEQRAAERLLKTRQKNARENGKAGGRPSKYGEPTVGLSGRVPESMVAEMDVYAEAAGLKRADIMYLACKAWLSAKRSRAARKKS